MMLLLIDACSARSSGVLMAHSSSRPSRAPDVTTVSGASVLIVGCCVGVLLVACFSLPMTTMVGSQIGV